MHHLFQSPDERGRVLRLCALSRSPDLVCWSFNPLTSGAGTATREKLNWRLKPKSSFNPLTSGGGYCDLPSWPAFRNQIPGFQSPDERGGVLRLPNRSSL